MSELKYFLLVVFFIDAFLMMGQYGANQLGGSVHYANYNGSISSSFDANGNYAIQQYGDNELPVGSASQSPTTGNIFTDPFTTIKNWFQSIPGVNYVTAAVNALPNWLQGFGIDPVFTYFISAIWHFYAIFLLAEFLMAR